MLEDFLRRCLYYQATHRSTKEAEFFLGNCARFYLDYFSESELAEFKKILEQQDYNIMNWYLEKISVPLDLNGPIMRLLLSFKYYGTYTPSSQ